MYVCKYECMCTHEAPLPAGCDLFTALSMLIKEVLQCNDLTLSGVLHKRCVAETSVSASDAMLVLDESSGVLDQQEVEELKETKEKNHAAAQSADKFHEKWRSCLFCLVFVFSYMFMYMSSHFLTCLCYLLAYSFSDVDS